MPIRISGLMLLLLVMPNVSPAASPRYENALVTRMRMVQCQEPPRHGNLIANLVVGSTSPIVMGGAECPEYEIEGTKVFYRVRPRRDVLIPVGEEVRFRIHKRDLLVLTDDANKEIEFSVVEMTLKAKHKLPELVAEQSDDRRQRKCLTMEGEVVQCGGK